MCIFHCLLPFSCSFFKIVRDRIQHCLKVFSIVLGHCYGCRDCYNSFRRPHRLALIDTRQAEIFFRDILDGRRAVSRQLRTCFKISRLQRSPTGKPVRLTFPLNRNKDIFISSTTPLSAAQPSVIRAVVMRGSHEVSAPWAKGTGHPQWLTGSAPRPGGGRIILLPRTSIDTQTPAHT